MNWQTLSNSEHSELLALIGCFDIIEEQARAGLVERIKGITSNNPDICKWRDKDGYLPLHRAVMKEMPRDILHVLIDSFPAALEMIGGSVKRNPLAIAVSSGRPVEPQVLQILTTPGAARSRDFGGRLPLHLYFEISNAHHPYLYPLNLECVRILVEAYPESIGQCEYFIVGSINQVEHYGKTPLHWAAIHLQEINAPIIQYLVDSCPHAVKQADHEFGQNPLHWACQCYSTMRQPGSPVVIQILVNACPEAAVMTDHEGKTPLHRLCLKSNNTGSLQAIRTLVEACPEIVQMVDNDGDTSLHHFCSHARTQDLPTVKFLVDAYPEALMTKNSLGLTPPHIAERQNRQNLDLGHFLIEKYPQLVEDDDLTSERGTPLHQFCQHGGRGKPIEYLKMLAISKRAIKAKNKNGHTPIHLLCRGGSSRERLQVLLEVFPAITKDKDNKGRIPLHAAIEGCAELSSPQTHVQHHETLQWLLEVYPKGMFVSDNEGKNPLQLACELNVHLSFVYQLVCFDPIMSLGLSQGSADASLTDDLSTRKRKRES